MEQKKYSYPLPKNGGVEPCETTTNSVVIIGANGSGKTRLGRWIEQKVPQQFRFISAQRALSFLDSFQMQNMDKLQEKLIKGESLNVSGNRRFTAISERRDVDTVFTSVFSHLFKELNIEDRKRKVNPSMERSDKISDKFIRIWNKVFSQREISFEELKLLATMPNGTTTYNAKEMSDGERVVLYLIAHTLLVPDGEAIIIDEPEIHLHRSIMNRLWSEIEKERSDCLFVYITHDTQFAANHKHSDKIWVKSYDGSVWEWEKIPPTDFPEQLLLDILGNRKPIIFVEGESDSYDTKLYSAVYSDYYIVPCGGCVEVISRTKAFRRLQIEQSQLHHIEAYGVIDRDYRTDTEITALESHKIYTLKVAEVENLFLTEEILTFINEHQGKTNTTGIDNAKNFVISDQDRGFCSQVAKQICEATVAEIKHRLSCIEISKKQDEAETSLNTALGTIDFEAIREEISTRYNSAAQTKDYKEILTLFNSKNVVKSIGSHFGIQDADYRNLVVRLISTDKASDIIEALQNYLPSVALLPIKIVQEDTPP